MRYLRALGALAVLLLFVIGLPAALALSIGNPLAGWSDLRAGDVSDTVVLDVLAAVFWLAWAQSVAVIAAETLALAGNTRLPRIPGALPGQQQLARTLLTAVFLLLPGASPVLGATTPLSAPSTAAAGIHSAATASSPGFAADATALAPGPAAAAASATALPAHLPHRPPPTQDVVITTNGPASFWELAEVHLGNGERWHEIWDQNQGRRQDDGSVLDSPHLLRAGWTIAVPLTDPGAGSHPDTAAGPRMPGGGGDEPDVRPETFLVAEPVAFISRTSDHSSGAAASAPSTAGASGALVSAVNVQPDDVPPSSLHLPSLGLGAGAGLLAGVCASELIRLRRRRFRHRWPGRTIEPTPAHLAPTQKAILTQGRPDVARAEFLDDCLRTLTTDQARAGNRLAALQAVRMSDEGLELILGRPRSLGRHQQPGPDQPGVPPPPWSVDPATGRWRHPAQTPERRPETVSAAQRQPLGRSRFAPYPALVSVAHGEDGSRWLLDLEHTGALALEGDRARCLDLARFIAAELAANTWSEQMQVTLLGFAAELSGLNPERLHHIRDTTATLTALERQLRINREALATSGLADVLDGRAQDVAADMWMPHVLIVDENTAITEAHQQEQFRLLVNALRQEPVRAGIAVLTVRTDPDPAGRWVRSGDPDQSRAPAGEPGKDDAHLIHIDGDGRILLPWHGAPLAALGLPAAEGAHLAQTMAASAGTADAPMPAAHGDAAWDAYCDAAGAPLPQALESAVPGERVTVPTTLFEPASPVRLVGGPGGAWPGEGKTGAFGGQSVSAVLARTATTSRDLGVLAPNLTVAARGAIMDADPGLDADVRDWHDPASPRARLSLLGPVQVRAGGQTPARINWHTEVVVYLAAHPRGVSAAQLGADLWPDKADGFSTSKLRQAVYLVRRWLGTDPDTGREHVPFANDTRYHPSGLYRVEGLLSDADLFRRLRLRGIARGDEGLADLETALALVTGAPLEQRRSAGYLWLLDTPLDAEYTSMIVDVAHLVATQHLAAGRPEQAADAARISLSAGSQDDVALLDLVAACENQGKNAEAKIWVRRILDNHDAEVEEDLPPRTAEILHRRHWLHQAG